MLAPEMNDKAPERRVPPARIQFLPEDRAWIAERLEEVLATGQLTLGKYGTQFEEKFAQYCGYRQAIGVNSGTSALKIILRALGIQGKDVLVPTNTFFATAAAVVHAGGRPILVDMDPESFGICPEAAEKCLTPNTVGLIAVHIQGLRRTAPPTAGVRTIRLQSADTFGGLLCPAYLPSHLFGDGGGGSSTGAPCPERGHRMKGF